MKVLTVVIVLISVIWSEEIASKMVLGAHTKSQEAAKDLSAIEEFFLENKEASRLKKMHHLTLAIESLDKYFLITIAPIKNSFVESRLHYFLKDIYPNRFTVPYTPHIQSVQNKMKQKRSKEIIAQQQPSQIEQRFFFQVDVEWIALILLALTGLIFAYIILRQHAKIRTLQKEIAKYQIILEKEVEDMEISFG